MSDLSNLSHSNVHIEKYKPEDFLSLVAINDDAYEEDLRPPVRTMRSMLFLCDTYVARTLLEKKIVGYIMIHDSTPRYLWSIAVDPVYQGFGVASQLMNILKGYGETVELHVSADNPAQKLYFDHGFRVIDVIKDYYPNSAGLLMRRS